MSISGRYGALAPILQATKQPVKSLVLPGAQELLTAAGKLTDVLLLTLDDVCW